MEIAIHFSKSLSEDGIIRFAVVGDTEAVREPEIAGFSQKNLSVAGGNKSVFGSVSSASVSRRLARLADHQGGVFRCGGVASAQALSGHRNGNQRNVALSPRCRKAK
jgi:hypothetical protein